MKLITLDLDKQEIDLIKNLIMLQSY